MRIYLSETIVSEQEANALAEHYANTFTVRGGTLVVGRSTDGTATLIAALQDDDDLDVNTVIEGLSFEAVQGVMMVPTVQDQGLTDEELN